MNSAKRQDDFEMDDGGLISNIIADIIFDPNFCRGLEARANANADSTASSAPKAIAPAAIAPETVEVRAPRKRKRRRASRKLKREPVTPPESALERHQRKCFTCSHPERETIDEQFLNWHSPMRIAIHYDLEIRGLFRHAHATGLYTSRQQNIRSALDRVLERADQANISADGIVRTVRAYTCLTPDNRWVEPPSRVIFSSASAPPLVVTAPSSQDSLNAAPAALLPSAHSNSADFTAPISTSSPKELIPSD